MIVNWIQWEILNLLFFASKVEANLSVRSPHVIITSRLRMRIIRNKMKIEHFHLMVSRSSIHTAQTHPTTTAQQSSVLRCAGHHRCIRMRSSNRFDSFHMQFKLYTLRADPTVNGNPKWNKSRWNYQPNQLKTNQRLSMSCAWNVCARIFIRNHTLLNSLALSSSPPFLENVSSKCKWMNQTHTTHRAGRLCQ